MPVVLARDPEGNGFGRLADCGESMVDPNEYRPEGVYPTSEQLAELMAQPGSPWTEEDEAPDFCSQRTLVLWPA